MRRRERRRGWVVWRKVWRGWVKRWRKQAERERKWREEWGRVRREEEETEMEVCTEHELLERQDIPGRLRERSQVWEGLGVSEKVKKWVRCGVSVVWKEEPRKSRKMNRVRKEDHSFAVRELTRMERLRVIEESEMEPRLCHAMVVAEKEGKCVCKNRRLCIDGLELNRASGEERERMEGLKAVKYVVRKDDWMIKVDIKDYYLHFQLEEKERTWWGVRWGRKWYKFRAAVFGFRRSAEVASRVSKEVMRALRKRGLRGIVWVDDFLFCFRSREEAERGKEVVVGVLESLGFLLSEKSELTPIQSIWFLGMIIDTKECVIQIPQEKVQRIVSDLKEVQKCIEDGNTLTARRLAEIMGRLNAIQMGFMWGRVVKGMGRAISMRRPRWMWGKKVVIRKELGERVEWVWRRVEENEGRKFGMEVGEYTIVWTDASGEWGWGVVVLRNGRIWRSGGTWREGERELHINEKELIAMRRIFERNVWDALGLKEGENWVWKVDSMVALAYVKKGGGRFQKLAGWAEEIWWEMAKRRIMLVDLQWVKSEWNWADIESRREERGGWRTRDWLRRWGMEVTRYSLGMDVFASEESAIVPSFFSKWDSPGSKGRNAFNWQWEDGSWVVPEIGDVEAAVWETGLRKVHAMIVVPGWDKGWMEWLRREAKWIVEWVEMKKEAVVFEPEGLKGLTELSGLKGKTWVMAWVCPHKTGIHWKGQRARSMRVHYGGLKGGAMAEEALHILRHHTCWKSTSGGWSCHKDGVVE